jgi:hypothetical protein
MQIHHTLRKARPANMESTRMKAISKPIRLVLGTIFTAAAQGRGAEMDGQAVLSLCCSW